MVSLDLIVLVAYLVGILAVTLVFGVAATVIACLTNGVIAALTIAYDLLVGALFVPVMGAMSENP